MADLIGAAMWQKYKEIINHGQETFNQQNITWLKSLGAIDRHGEDNQTERFSSILLKGLLDYNYFRKWAVNNTSLSGELDRQNEVLLLNINYLRNNNYLGITGGLNYDMAADRFIHNGVKYKSVGDTLVSQAQDEALLFMIILQREELQTGSFVGDLPSQIDSCSTSLRFTDQTTVIFNHFKGRHVDVTVYDLANNEIFGEVDEDISLNTITVSFNKPQSGIIVVD